MRAAAVTPQRPPPLPTLAPLPAWAHRMAPIEARPSRPLSPSTLGEDMVAEPPNGMHAREAAERGRLIHALFERLPALPMADRAAAADRWLSHAGGVADPAQRGAIADGVLAMLADPMLADLFAGEALTEAPVTATLADGTVVAGTVDRLLVTADRVRIIDYKTGRIRSGLDEVPPYHLAQMAAYAAALEVIFPDRVVEAALLYTAGPALIEIPAAMLAAHKPRFARVEQS